MQICMVSECLCVLRTRLPFIRFSFDQMGKAPKQNTPAENPAGHFILVIGGPGGTSPAA
jgi:hypothetical protein